MADKILSDSESACQWRAIPILFSGPMVRALLDGRKTQTRRVLKEQPGDLDRPFMMDDGSWHVGSSRGHHMSPLSVRWKKGDQLWVRETVACGACAGGPPSSWAPSFWRREQGTPTNPNGIWYQADGLEPENPITSRGKWRPAIHMPRWASRLTLTVTEVRVQRLQQLTPADAIAEGITPRANSMSIDCDTPDPREEFSSLWTSINGTGSWASNPWVVALTFTVKHQNIDRALATEAK